eukprot:319556_1
MNTTEISLFAIAFFCIAIAIPLIGYHGLKYFKNRDHVVFEKRYANITICEVVLAIIKFGSMGVYMIFTAIVSKKGRHITDSWSTIEADVVYIICEIGNICFLLIFYCWLIRFTVLSFDLKFTVLLKENEWKSIIDKSYEQNKRLEWFENNRNRFGNFRFVRLILFPFILYMIIVNVILALQYIKLYKLLSNKSLSIIDMSNHFVLLLLLLFIYRTVPKIMDNFFISAELKRMIVLFVFQNIFYGTGLVSTMWIKTSFWVNILYPLCIILVFILDLFMILVCTYWVNRMCEPLVSQYRKHYTPIEYSYMTLKDDYKNNKIDLSKHENDKKLKLHFINICEREDEFAKFADFMRRDVCLNSLLCWMEITQFQQYLSKQNSNKQMIFEEEKVSLSKCSIDSINGPNMNSKYYLYKQIKFYIKSTIVYSNQNSKEKAHKIFKKYIKPLCGYEVLMDHNIRISYVHTMEQLNGDLSHLFDKAIDELFDTIINSFQRWINTQPNYSSIN